MYFVGMEKTQKCCLYSVCEVMVHLHELRSFDLPLTSSYCIRTTIECAQTSDSNSANAALFARNREIVGYFEVNHTGSYMCLNHSSNIQSNTLETNESQSLSKALFLEPPKTRHSKESPCSNSLLSVQNAWKSVSITLKTQRRPTKRLFFLANSW